MEQALWVPGEQAAAATARLIRRLGDLAGVGPALGVWADPGVELAEAFVEELQPIHVGPLTGQEELDAWASRNTGGLLRRMPVAVGAGDLLVLAGALVADARWTRSFEWEDRMRWWGEPAHADAWSGPTRTPTP